MTNKASSVCVFLDANVIVKILDGYEVKELSDSIEVFISSISFNIVSYLWEAKKINCTLEELKDFFSSVNILTVDQDICWQGLELSDYRDIEDGLQIACALDNRIDLLLTYDKKMYQKYKNNLSITLCE